jgi:hypothetical protein
LVLEPKILRGASSGATKKGQTGPQGQGERTCRPRTCRFRPQRSTCRFRPTGSAQPVKLALTLIRLRGTTTWPSTRMLIGRSGPEVSLRETPTPTPQTGGGLVLEPKILRGASSGATKRRTQTGPQGQGGKMQVACPCGENLGEFYHTDDNGCVGVVCPKCKQRLLIHNQILMCAEAGGETSVIAEAE